jgi:hypothetical protein
VITLDGPPIVDHVSADLLQNQVVVVQAGGQVGQDSITFYGSPGFQPGVHALVFLAWVDGPNGTRVLTPTSAGPAWNVFASYMLTDYGNVIVDGKPQLATDLIAKLKAAAPGP